jgi:hypothetical protein
MRPVKFLSAFIVIALFFLSCNKANEQASGVGDALIVVKKINNQVVYGVSLYAYTYSSFRSVTVTSSSNPSKNYTLEASQGFKTNFYYETPDGEFSATKPVAGTYTFSAVFENGVTQQFTDVLTDKVLNVPEVTKCEYSADNHRLEVNWNLVTDANGYAVNLFDGTNVIFSSAALADNIKAYAVTASGNGWATGFVPEAGKAYTVRVLAFLFEPGGDTYNVQSTSVTDTRVVWGN